MSEDNRVLLGGLTSIAAPAAAPRRHPPARFLREMACVDARLRPLERPECADFEPLKADGFAIHPYMLKQPPTKSLPDPDSVRMADLGRLSRLLGTLADRGRIEEQAGRVRDRVRLRDRPARCPPRGLAPDCRRSTCRARWARRWPGPSVRMHAQFLLRDLSDDGLYQTGLQQPAAGPSPRCSRSRASWCDGDRPGSGAPRPGRSLRVRGAPRRADRWVQTGCLETDPDGVVRRGGIGRGTWRLRWDQPGKRPLYSLPTRAG